MPSKLIRAFLNDRFFTTREASKFVRNENTRKSMLKQLMNSGQIVHVRKGLYEVVPLEQVGKKKPAADKFLLARKVTYPYCLVYHSALEIQGFANSALYNIVYVASPNQFRNFEYEGVWYRWVPRKNLDGKEKIVWSTAQVVVSDRERTILDCVDRIDLAGGFEEAFKSLSSMANVNFDRLFRYAREERKKVLFHKLGLFLSFGQIKESWHVTDENLKLIRHNISPRTYYFETSSGEGKFVRKWNIIVPEKMEEMMSFA
ncbi:MAG: type IV toxin-antitoxin system AbiEi family antitoxin domain-containing protein [Nitrososphaerales archaeon]